MRVTTEDICPVNTACEVTGAPPAQPLLTQGQGGWIPNVPETKGWTLLCVHSDRSVTGHSVQRLKHILQGKEGDVTLEVDDIF